MLAAVFAWPVALLRPKQPRTVPWPGYYIQGVQYPIDPSINYRDLARQLAEEIRLGSIVALPAGLEFNPIEEA
jgi:hypothetical protein